MDTEKLKKALKFKIAAERGDEQIRDLANQKYFDFLLQNNLTHEQVAVFEKQESQGKLNKKVLFEYEGKQFFTMPEFLKFYENLKFKEKLKVAIALGLNKK